ncbi:phosphotransferase enzyme family protein [Gryllotalpicola ginsengisoli]|uniref:phosphotransferase enzyme family protein n=1 Tax=Gryllotalpicola ginsengisoli TaxID=444608 RepID=UPI0003B6E8CC|nr:aminoglycoside phosphotransferase family protein [Gryllotalpicola ginsengisoli]
MTDARPDPEQLRWALQVLDASGLVEVTGMRSGGAPWLLRYLDDDGVEALAVMRVGSAQQAESQTRETVAMQLADRQGIPVPNVLGARLDDASSLLLIEHIDGSSAQPAEPRVDRLEALGALAVQISVVNPGDADLPRVDRPIPVVDFAAMRAEGEPQPLLEEAERRLAEITAEGPTGFVHGDLWSGNTLWRGDELVAVLDWDCAGIGPAGVDLGSLRCDAAMQYGLEASDHVLAGWRREASREPEALAYWDAVAALSTPPDIAWFAPAIAGMTHRPDLTAELLRQRRDAFLAYALERLG